MIDRRFLSLLAKRAAVRVMRVAGTCTLPLLPLLLTRRTPAGALPQHKIPNHGSTICARTSSPIYQLQLSTETGWSSRVTSWRHCEGHSVLTRPSSSVFGPRLTIYLVLCFKISSIFTGGFTCPTAERMHPYNPRDLPPSAVDFVAKFLTCLPRPKVHQHDVPGKIDANTGRPPLVPVACFAANEALAGNLQFPWALVFKLVRPGVHIMSRSSFRKPSHGPSLSFCTNPASRWDYVGISSRATMSEAFRCWYRTPQLKQQ